MGMHYRTVASAVTPCNLVLLPTFGKKVISSVLFTTDGDNIFFPPGATQPIVVVYFTALYRALAFSRTRLLDHTQRHTTVGRTPLNE